MAVRASSSAFEGAIHYALERFVSTHLGLKEEQLKATRAVYEGKNVFVWLPTGFGKSLCYQAIPFVMDYKLKLVGTSRSSAVIIVSSLIAVMVDQIQTLRSTGVKASIIYSGSDLAAPFIATESNLCSDSLLFSSPEALITRKWRDALENSAVSEWIVAVAIDEAHCVSKW